jgi:hypothetical protein
MVLKPSLLSPWASAWSTSRLTMVGAANIESGPAALASANSSAGSTPPDAGTMWRAPAIRWGMA